ncbi:MAG: alpha/beta hydrolase [Spirochaetota bacterium]|nr:alpha/beta hydrolase [Spirochaetota bacterium]
MFLDKGEKQLYYEVQGDGEPALLFVHGWLGSGAVWREQVPYFSQKRRVVTFDLTGYGRSAKPKGLRYTPDVWFDDIDLLIEQNKLNKPVLIGWSMGGDIAIGYALSRPEALSKLVIVDSTPLLVAPPEVFEYGTPPEMAEQIAEAMQNDFSTGTRGFAEMLFPEPDSDGLKDEFHAITQQTTALIALDSIGNAGAVDLRPMLDQVQIPTLVLHGENDAVCPLGAGQCLYDMIPNARIHTFPGKGHAPFLTDAQAFNERLADFI